MPLACPAILKSRQLVTIPTQSQHFTSSNLKSHRYIHNTAKYIGFIPTLLETCSHLYIHLVPLLSITNRKFYTRPLVNNVNTGAPNFSRPFKNPSSNKKQNSITVPPHIATNFSAACALPPVAIISSTITTLLSSRIAPRCISKKSSPYSFLYPTFTHSPGNFPAFRTGTKAAPSFSAREGPKRKPRASRPTTMSIPAKGGESVGGKVAVR